MHDTKNCNKYTRTHIIQKDTCFMHVMALIKLIKLRGVQHTALFGVLTAVLLKNKDHWNVMLYQWVTSPHVSKYCSLGTTYSMTSESTFILLSVCCWGIT